MLVGGGQLDQMTLEVFSKLNDSLTPSDVAWSFHSAKIMWHVKTLLSHGEAEGFLQQSEKNHRGRHLNKQHLWVNGTAQRHRWVLPSFCKHTVKSSPWGYHSWADTASDGRVRLLESFGEENMQMFPLKCVVHNQSHPAGLTDEQQAP